MFLSGPGYHHALQKFGIDNGLFLQFYDLLNILVIITYRIKIMKVYHFIMEISSHTKKFNKYNNLRIVRIVHLVEHHVGNHQSKILYNQHSLTWLHGEVLKLFPKTNIRIRKCVSKNVELIDSSSNYKLDPSK